MSFKIPQKASGSVSSEIRIVLERGRDIPDFISLAIGNPAKEAIPVDKISVIKDGSLSDGNLTVWPSHRLYGA